MLNDTDGLFIIRIEDPYLFVNERVFALEGAGRRGHLLNIYQKATNIPSIFQW